MNTNDNSKRDQWIDEVLNSAENIRATEPHTELKEKIIHRMFQPLRVATISRSTIIRAAAAVALLLAANVVTIIHYNKVKSSASSTNIIGSNPVADEYFNYPDNN